MSCTKIRVVQSQIVMDMRFPVFNVVLLERFIGGKFRFSKKAKKKKNK